MNKKLIWIILAIIVIALIAYFTMNRQPDNASTGNNSVKSQSVKQSLKDLLTAGQSVKCEFNNTEAKSAGTVYIADKKVRGDFSTMIDNKAMTSHMITDNDTSYIWTEGQTSGFKMTLSKEDKAELNDQAKQNQGIDPDEKMDYQCSPWSASNDSFKLPSDVEFKDFSALIPAVNTNAEGEASGKVDLKALHSARLTSGA
jgi:hypothetical protein